MKSSTRGTLTMNRKGRFTVRTYGNSHCGTAEILKIKYAVKVECNVTLDERGFLFDQVNIDKFFQGIKTTKLSCEQFAIECSRKLWMLIHDENKECHIRDMSLSLSPAPYAASMTFNYNSLQHGGKKKLVKSIR